MYESHQVIPIHKSKEQDLRTDYRPISLFPALSKMLEQVMHKRLYSFLQKSNILYKHQYGFRKPTIDAVSELVKDTLISLEEQEHTVALFLDLNKAFDMIGNKIMLRKLQNYGIWGITLDWFF